MNLYTVLFIIALFSIVKTQYDVSCGTPESVNRVSPLLNPFYNFYKGRYG